MDKGQKKVRIKVKQPKVNDLMVENIKMVEVNQKLMVENRRLQVEAAAADAAALTGHLVKTQPIPPE